MKFNPFQNLKKAVIPSLFAIFLSISTQAEAQILTPFPTGLPDPNTGSAHINSIAASPDGSILFSYDFSHNTRSGIARMTPLGTVTIITEMTGTPRPGTANWTEEKYLGITVGSDGNIWYAKHGHIGRLSPTGIVTEFNAGLPPNFADFNSFTALTSHSDGNIWFVGSSIGFSIGRITPTGIITMFPGPSNGIGGITDITSGPDGNVWFTSNAGFIGHITPSGTYTLFSEGITPDSRLNSITTGPDGNLWFTVEQDRIGRITPAGVVTEFSEGIAAGSTPHGIATGSDGNIWFTQYGSSRIARITPSGEVSEFFQSIHFRPRPRDMISSANGNIWFSNNLLYRISFNPNVFQDPTLNNFTNPLPPIYTRPDKFPGTDPNPPDPKSKATLPMPEDTKSKMQDSSTLKQAPSEQKLAPTPINADPSMWDKVMKFLK